MVVQRLDSLPYPEFKLELPFFHKDTLIWNDVSPIFKNLEMVVELGEMKRTFTGSELTKMLAVIPIHPQKVWLHYQPSSQIRPMWKPVQMGLYSFLT